MPKHTYRQAERFLLSREFFGMKLGLENITRFLDFIGSPQRAYPTIHIAGTNGKGSVAAMLDAILRAAGYKCGLYTSPHLVDMRERIRVNGRKIPAPSVAAFVDRHRPELTKRKLSFFEVMTALALEHFEKTRVDVAVIETGLGGRLDATNVLAPLLTIVTDISHDHMDILGASLTKIAREKAGIIKPSTPHLVGLLPCDALEVMERRCRELDAPFHQLRSHDYSLDTNLMRLDFHCNGLAVKGLSPSLYGSHQLRNAALAMKAVSLLTGDGLPIRRQAVLSGLKETSWPGRFHLLQRRGQPTIVCDVCHNAGGVAAFVESFHARFPGRKADVIVGFVKRKEHQLMFDSLASMAQSYGLVPLRTHRSADLKELLEQIDFQGIPVRRCGSLSGACRRLLRRGRPDDIMTVVGSHFLVGEFFKKFGFA